MICDGSFVKLTQREMYGIAETDLVDHSTGAPASYHILEHPIEAMVQFTRYLLIIDFITYSSLSTTDTKWNQALRNTPQVGLILHTICLFFISWGDCVGRMFQEAWLDYTAQIIIVHPHHLTARHLLDL